MHVLITGGAGFIGSNLARYHIDKNDTVTILDDLSTGSLQNIESILTQPNIKFYHKNLLTWSNLKSLLPNVDRIYHLAAVVGMFNVLKAPVHTLNVNILSTMRLMEALKDLEHKPLTLIASSSEVYGNQPSTLSESFPLMIESSLKNHASYPISKLCDESLAHAYGQEYQIPCITLRIFNTIGHHQTGKYGMVVPRFIKQALSNKDITVYGDGQQKRSFCDVRDLVQIMDIVANTPAFIGEVINIGNNEQISIIELAQCIKNISGSHAHICFIPLKQAYSKEYINISERKPDLSRLFSRIIYRYQWNIDTTLKDLIRNK